MQQDNILKTWLERWSLSPTEGAKVLLINKSKVSEYTSGKRPIPPYIAAHIETFNALPDSKANKIIKERLATIPIGN